MRSRDYEILNSRLKISRNRGSNEKKELVQLGCQFNFIRTTLRSNGPKWSNFAIFAPAGQKFLIRKRSERVSVIFDPVFDEIGIMPLGSRQIKGEPRSKKVKTKNRVPNGTRLSHIINSPTSTLIHRYNIKIKIMQFRLSN